MTPSETNALNAWLDSLVPVYNPDGRLPVTREEAGMLWMMEHVRDDMREWVKDQLPPGAPIANIFYGGYAMDMLRELLGQPALDPRAATWVNYRDNPYARDAALQRMFEQMLLAMPKPQQGTTTVTIDTATVRALASDLVGATYMGNDIPAALRKVVQYAASVGITAGPAPILPNTSPGEPEAYDIIPSRAIGPNGLPDTFLFAAAGLLGDAFPPFAWWRGDVEWCVNYAEGSSNNATPLVQQWTVWLRSSLSVTGFIRPRWSEAELKLGARRTLNHPDVNAALKDEPRYQRALLVLDASGVGRPFQ